MDDIVIAKAAIVERCLRRVLETYRDNPARLQDPDAQDVIVLNLERACQAAIDLAMHAAAVAHLGVPESSAQVFDLLASAGHIDPPLARHLRAMVGFRNVAVHRYRDLDLAVLQEVIERGSEDLKLFCRSFGIEIHP